jgi:hypothetical protein
VRELPQGDHGIEEDLRTWLISGRYGLSADRTLPWNSPVSI